MDIDRVKFIQFPYIETSAKKGTNVEYLMEFTMHEMWLQTQTNVIDWNDVSNERFMSKNVNSIE